MTTFFATLGVIIAVLLIGYIIYRLFFKTKSADTAFSADKPFVFDKDNIKIKKDSDNNMQGTVIPSLLYFTLESTGLRYEVKSIPKDGVTVGRAAPSDIIVTSPKGNFLSAEHFVICYDDEGMYLNVIDRAHDSGNGIRLEADLKSPKIKSSINITHKLKIFVGNDAITFYLPNMMHEDIDGNVDETPVKNNRVTRRK